MDLVVRRKDGSHLTGEVRTTPIHGPDGSLVEIQGIIRDVTEQRRIENAIRSLIGGPSSETGGRFFDEMVTHLSSVLEADYTFINAVTDASQSTVRTISFCADGKIGEPFEYTLEGAPCANVMRGEKCSYPSGVADLFPADAPLRDMGIEAYVGVPLRGRDGELLGLIVALFRRPLEDVELAETILELFSGRIAAEMQRTRAEEERRRLEAQLQRAQRLESIGVLAGGVAHDFNNILAGILGFTEMARDAVAPGSAAAAYLERVISGVDRAKELVQQILAFSRQEPASQRVLRLRTTVEDALRLVRASVPSSVEMSARLDPDTPPVKADAVQIHQVAVNLCTNAEHSMRPKGGILTVTLGPAEIDAHEAAQLGGIAPGTYAVLSVSDTGCGMDAATLERVFDPFFTTKPVGEGTGLGLAMCYGIVTNHGGAISVGSEVGAGTTVNVYLPVAVESSAMMAPDDGPVPTGTGRVLFVDDEEALATLGERRLRSLGYQPTVFRSSQEALDAILKDPFGFDLILTDLTMPRMSGLDLIAKARKAHIAVPAIIMTGRSAGVAAEARRQLRVHSVLPKPYSKRELAEAVHRALAGDKG
jgi:signal transduction histidine kinase/CheY-like chemotaxis protein